MGNKTIQWDYVGNYVYGESEIMCENPQYARYVNPYTREIKDILIRKGNKW